MRNKVLYKVWYDEILPIPSYFCGKSGEGNVVVFRCTNLDTLKLLYSNGLAEVVSHRKGKEMSEFLKFIFNFEGEHKKGVILQEH